MDFQVSHLLTNIPPSRVVGFVDLKSDKVWQSVFLYTIKYANQIFNSTILYTSGNYKLNNMWTIGGTVCDSWLMCA